MLLSDCKPGEGGTIVRVHGEGAIVQRLMELGLFDGAQVKVIRVAPLGDPIEVDLGTSLLSLRKSEASHVELAP